MGLDTIPDRVEGTPAVTQDWFNLLKRVLTGDIVPRNSSGVATAIAGNLGSATYRWLAAYLPTFKIGATHFVTFNPNATTPAPYSITTPAALPASTAVWNINADGTTTFEPIADVDFTPHTITQGKLEARTTGQTVGAGGVALSTGSGSFAFTNTGTPTDITGTDVVITTTGRPVAIMLQPTAGASMQCTTSGSYRMNIQVLRGTTVISEFTHQNTTLAHQVDHLDAPVAGTYTYKLRYYISAVFSGSPSGTLQNYQLVAYEI